MKVLGYDRGKTVTGFDEERSRNERPNDARTSSAKHGCYRTFQRRTVLSPLTAATSLPSGDKATDATRCGDGMVFKILPDATSHSRMLVGCLLVMSLNPPVRICLRPRSR